LSEPSNDLMQKLRLYCELKLVESPDQKIGGVFKLQAKLYIRLRDRNLLEFYSGY